MLEESISVRINLQTFDVDIEPIIENEQEVVKGEIILAEDTEEGVEGIAISIYLKITTT